MIGAYTAAIEVVEHCDRFEVQDLTKQPAVSVCVDDPKVYCQNEGAILVVQGQPQVYLCWKHKV